MSNLRRLPQEEHFDQAPPPPPPPPNKSSSASVGLAFLLLSLFLLAFPFIPPVPPDWLTIVLHWLAFAFGVIGVVLVGDQLGERWTSRH